MSRYLGDEVGGQAVTLYSIKISPDPFIGACSATYLLILFFKCSLLYHVRYQRCKLIYECLNNVYVIVGTYVCDFMFV